MSSISEQLAAYGKSTGPRKKGFRLGATIDTSRLSYLGFGAKCCKLSLTALTVFLFLTGIAVCAGGGYIQNDDTLIVVIGTTFCNCILAFGVLLMFLGALGVAGAVRENRMLLSCFMGLMGLLLIALLAFGAWALSNVGNEGALLSTAWATFDNDAKVAIETALTCCGAYYWGEATETTTCPKPCNTAAGGCDGCFPQLISYMRQAYTAFGVIFVILAVIMLCGLITTFCLLSGMARAAEVKAEKTGKGGKRGHK